MTIKSAFDKLNHRFIKTMTKDDLLFLINTKKEFEFKYNGLVYNMTYGTDKKGDYIALGRLYEPVRYYSFGEMMNKAKIENHFFREILDVL